MEESLSALRIKICNREVAAFKRIDNRHGSRYLAKAQEKLERLEAHRIEAGFPNFEDEKWSQPNEIQDIFLIYFFDETDYVSLRSAAKETKTWLKRAAKQKELLTTGKLQECHNGVVAKKPVTGRMELKPENPAVWLPV